jgi:hypothetical protein
VAVGIVSESFTLFVAISAAEQCKHTHTQKATRGHSTWYPSGMLTASCRAEKRDLLFSD